MSGVRMQRAPRERFALGVVAALVGASMWGLSGSCVQFLTGRYGVAPAFLTMFRSIAGGVLFMAILLVMDRHAVKRMLSDRREVTLLVAFGFCLFANLLTYAMTVQLTNAGNATVLQMLASVFVMAFACVRSRRLPSVREAIALALALLATLCMATQGDITTLDMPVAGLAWGLLCGLSAAAYILFPRESGLAERFGSVNVTGAGTCASALFAIPCALALEASGAEVMASAASLDATGWAVILVGIVLVGTIGAYGLYLYGVSVVGSVRGSLLGAMEPVSATAFSALWLGTAFSGFDMAGLVLMIAMLVLITERGRPERAG